MDAECRAEVETLLNRLYSNATKNSIHEGSNQFKHLQLLLTNLLVQHEGNSTIIVAPPNSGKSIFVHAALQIVLTKHPTLQPPKVLTLSGLLSKNLKSTVLSISRSLKFHDELSELIGPGQNFEDRLADVLQFLKISLATKFKSTPLVIILDRVDLFAEHRAQALLYNLLDIVQNKESPLFVIGLTARVDILELLEKRVKSRFSHRCLHLPPPSFTAYSAFAKDLLTLEIQSKRDLVWNASVADLFSTTSVQEDLGKLYAWDKTVGALIQFLSTILITSGKDGLTGAHFRATWNETSGSSTLKQGLDLTETEMFIMLGIQHAIKGGNAAAFTFESLEQTLKRAGGAYSSKGKEDFQAAFNSLIKQELITPVDHRKNSANKFYKSEIRGEEIRELFKLYQNLPTVFQSLT